MTKGESAKYANGCSADSTPTNRDAAKRPYCKKHSRAMLDIGGKKQCPICKKEKPEEEES